MKKLHLAALVAGVSMMGSAQADIITSSASIGPLVTDLTGQAITLDQFDPTNGTLNSISIKITGNSESSTVLSNTSANGQLFSFDSNLSWLFDVPTVGSFLTGFDTLLGSTGGPTALASGGILDLGTTTDMGMATYAVTDLAAYTGAGTFDLNCYTLTGTTFSGGGGNITNVQNTTATCGAEVTYDFTAAPPPQMPEPGTLALMGLGLAGIGRLARRK